jgi:hypothetical protein
VESLPNVIRPKEGDQVEEEEQQNSKSGSGPPQGFRLFFEASFKEPKHDQERRHHGNASPIEREHQGQDHDQSVESKADPFLVGPCSHCLGLPTLLNFLRSPKSDREPVREDHPTGRVRRIDRPSAGLVDFDPPRRSGI